MSESDNAADEAALKARRRARNKGRQQAPHGGVGKARPAAAQNRAKRNGPKAQGAARARRTAGNQAVANAGDAKPSLPSKAGPARMRRRHWGLVASFIALVLAPLILACWYLWAVAEDQYYSTAGFIVRSQESSGATDLLGGLAQFSGGSTASDSDILYEFIQSRNIVTAVEETVGLRDHFSAYWDRDPVFALWPDASLEDLDWYWQRILSVSYDAGSGLTELRVVAYEPEMARAILNAVVAESQAQINALNEQARADALGYAQADLEEALARLKGAREELTAFRTRTRIVDPAADIQGRMGVMNTLQQQLAEALIEYDLMRGSLLEGDLRLKTAQSRIDVIRDRLVSERGNFTVAGVAPSETSEEGQTRAQSDDYPQLIAEYERLNVDLQYAEETYRAALTALEAARDEAARQSRYLATYITPTLAQDSEYPNRPLAAGLIVLFMLLSWSIIVLIYYSIRDRS